MSDSHTFRLESALAGRYRVERKLGEGGMASVIGAERFVAEIKTTANLQHPNILALFDSGEADGFLYYVGRIGPSHNLPPYRVKLMESSLETLYAIAWSRGTIGWEGRTPPSCRTG